ncbi:MAG: TolB family protein, partial [Acidimicrobiales bacterium]
MARWLIAAVVAGGSAVVPGARPTDAAVAGEVTLASHTPLSPATAPVGTSDSARSSADGAFVVFHSTATNLVAGQSDANWTSDVFLFERATGVVTLVSHTPASSTTTANAFSFISSISADGAFVVFTSTATNLVAGQGDANSDYDVFLFQRATGAVTLVSHIPDSATSTALAVSFDPWISADGAFVVFRSPAPNLVGQGDANNDDDVFLFERATGVVTLVSHTPAGATTTANADSFGPWISADGAFVVFGSLATNLVAAQSDANGGGDVFLFQRATGAVTLVSHTPASSTTTANGFSSRPSISADGAFVTFDSSATNLVAGQIDANNDGDVFLFERATGAVTLVSHIPDSATTTSNSNSTTTSNNNGLNPSSSADGGFVLFTSAATNLVAGQSDANGAGDVFLFQRATGAVTLVSHIPAGATTTANSGSGLPSISADGAFVVFSSIATNLVAGQIDPTGTTDMFLLQRATGAVTLVSHIPASATTTANADSFSPSISADGAFVAFHSVASDLVAGQSDANNANDVFQFRRTATAA